MFVPFLGGKVQRCDDYVTYTVFTAYVVFFNSLFRLHDFHHIYSRAELIISYTIHETSYL